MLFCFRYKKLLMPYAEGALGADLRTRVEEHVSRCPSCAAELVELQSVSSALKVADVPAAEPAPDLWMRVQQAITEPVPVRNPWWQLKSYHIASAAAVAGVFLIAVLSVQLPMEKRIPEPASRVETPRNVQQESEVKRPSLATPKPVRGPVSAGLPKTPSKAYIIHPDTSASLSPKQAPLKAGRVTTSNGPALPPPPGEPVSKGLKRGDLVGDYYEDSTELKAKADAMPNEKIVRSPFSQMGRASGGSQNAAVIEKSQNQLHDYLSTGNKPERIETASRPMAPAAPPPPSPAAAPDKPTASRDKDAPGRVVGIDEPLVVADAPGSVLGSACNVWPPLTKSKKGATQVSNGDAKEATGYNKQSFGAAAVSADKSMGLARSESEESRKPSGGVVAGTNVTDKMKRIGDIEERIKKNPRDAGAWLELAETYEQAGQTEKSKDAYRKAIEFGDKAIRITAEAKLKKLEGRKK